MCWPWTRRRVPEAWPWWKTTGSSSSAAAIRRARTPSGCRREILSVLQDVGLALPAVDVFAVAAGPGSFTGLRIGIATIQGLAFVQHRRVVAVSALEALAHAGERGAPGRRASSAPGWTRIAATCSLRLYRVADAPLRSPGSPRRSRSAGRRRSGVDARTMERMGAPVDLFIGDGAVLYEEMIGMAGLSRRRCWRARSGSWPSTAPARGDRRSRWQCSPLYVRRPDAETRRERLRRCVLGSVSSRLTSPAEIDDVLAVEQASFTNPWTREMYLAELGYQGVSFLYVARDAGGRVVGFCSFWRVSRRAAHQQSRRAARSAGVGASRRPAGARARGGAQPGQPPCARWRSGTRTIAARRLYERVRVSWSPASAAGITPIRSRTRWCSGGKSRPRRDAICSPRSLKRPSPCGTLLRFTPG